MTQPAHVTFFHAPQSRSGGALALLEELGADYELHLLDLKAGTQRAPAYLAVNPLGERYTAADVLWGNALNWTTMFKLVPETPAIRSYVERVLARPAIRRAAAKDAEWLAAQRG